MMLPVAILAGGLATRLRPLTDRQPKSLVTVAGRPFVFHQLELLRRQGIKKAVLCVGHLGAQIESAVGDGREFGVDVRYSFDGPELLGTGGALKKSLPLLGERFFVLNGDSYLPCDLAGVAASFFESGRAALMTVLRNDNRWDRSNVVYGDGAVIEYDKFHPHAGMRFVDYGLSIFERDVFARYPDAAPVDLAEVSRDLARAGQLAGLEMLQRFYEIGSPLGLGDTEIFLGHREETA